MQSWWLRGCVASLGLGCVVAVIGGCTKDEVAETRDVKMRNDTGRVLVVQYSATKACNRFKYARRLAPRASAAVWDSGDETSWWLVLDDRRARVGLLKLDRSRRGRGIRSRNVHRRRVRLAR